MALTLRSNASLLIVPFLLAGCGLSPSILPAQGSSQVTASKRLTEWDAAASKAQDLASGTLKRWAEMTEELNQAQSVEDKCAIIEHMRDLLRQRINTLSKLKAEYPNNTLIAEISGSANNSYYELTMIYLKPGNNPQEKLANYTADLNTMEKKIIPVLKDIRSIQ